jgi:uncharacterized protein YbjT (DUF2867 family)
MTILVTGATGNIGRHVVDDLLEAGEKVRALTRDPATAGLPDDVEVLPGDLTDADAVAVALEGVHAVHLFPVLDAVGEFVRLAGRAGVERVVMFTGAWAAGLTRRDRESWTFPRYRAAERLVEQGGMAWTILRPGPFALNLRWWAGSIRAEGLVRAPHGRAICPLVHEADIAAVAAAALTRDGHAGARYVLTGPAATSQVEQAQAVGRALGRDIRFEEITEREWRNSVQGIMRPGIAEDMLRAWAETVADPAEALPVSPAVELVTGRPARSVEQWARDHVADFA